MTFPNDYPTSPPRVDFVTFVNHLNIVPSHSRGTWEVCLDMLLPPSAAGVAAPYVNWSSVMSARSILMQLTSFLLCDAHESGFSENQDDLTREQLIARMRLESGRSSCSHCGHRHDNITPKLPTVQQVREAPHAYPPLAVSSQDAVELRARRYARMRAVSMLEKRQTGQVEEKPKNTWSSVASKGASTTVSTTMPTISLANLPLLQAYSDPAAFFDCWNKLTTNGTLAASFGYFSRLSGVTITEEVFSYLRTNDITALMATCRAAVVVCDDESVWKRLFRQRFPYSSLRPIGTKPKGAAAAAAAAAACGVAGAATADATSVSSLLTSSVAESATTAATAASGGGSEDDIGWTVVKGKVFKPKAPKVKGIGKGKKPLPNKKRAAVPPAKAAIPPVAPTVPQPVDSIPASAPPVQLDLSQLGNVWKHLYMLELNGAASEPTCFYSKRTRQDSVMGIPLTYTVNPVTKQLGK